MQQGQSAYQAGKYEEAAQDFLKAYAAKPMPAFLYNAGMAYEKGGEPGKAADYYSRYLAGEPNAPDATEVRARIDRLRTQAQGSGTGIEIVTRTEHHTIEVHQDHGPPAKAPAPPPAPAPQPQNMKSMLSIQTTPRGAQIRVMGPAGMVAQGASPFLQTLASGQYDVIIEKPGFRKVERPVSVEPGKVYTLIIEMSQGKFAGLVRVISTPPGATVYFDDKAAGAVGKTPWQTQATAGKHKVWLERAGYVSTEREVTVEAGKEQPLKVDLKRVGYGKLRVVANVEHAQVRIDGEIAGEVPLEVKLDAGPHDVEVRADGMKPWESSVIVAGGQLTPVRVQLHAAVPRGGAWTTAVLAAMMLGGGTTLAVMSGHRYDSLHNLSVDGRLASDDRRLFKGKMITIGADVGFGLGGLLALVSIYYFVRDPLPPSEGTVLKPRDWSVTPAVGPTAAGAQLEVRF